MAGSLEGVASRAGDFEVVLSYEEFRMRAADHGEDAIHLMFSKEKVRADYLAPTPPIQPIVKQILRADVLVIPLADLLRMKLTSFRSKLLNWFRCWRRRRGIYFFLDRRTKPRRAHHWLRTGQRNISLNDPILLRRVD